MRPSEIEHWALKVIEQVKSRQPQEDSRVELKAVFLPPQQAARRLAGHANAARGESILWLLGVDEEIGVRGVEHKELANWWGAVKAEFDHLAPSMTDVNIPVGNVTVLALLFDTDRAPFVVKNPSFGKGKGEISLEVPWREGTAVRTATRSDLIRLLVPILHMPEVEVLGGELKCFQGQAHLEWDFTLNLYVVPAIGEGIVFPFHRCEASFEIVGLVPRTVLNNIRIGAPTGFAAKPSLTVQNTDYEVILTGPGPIILRCRKTGMEISTTALQDSIARIEAKLVLSYGERVVPINAVLHWVESAKILISDKSIGTWLS